jgi:hypothetical protein
VVVGDSSEFSSQDYEPYIEKLKMDIKKKKAVLNQRQEKLLSGVFLKEQEIRNLIKLGLGFMLKEIKI